MAVHAPARDDLPPTASVSSPREVVAAWLALILLALATGASFALDHMVTVSDRTDWSSLSTTPVVPSDLPGETPRETRDRNDR